MSTLRPLLERLKTYAVEWKFTFVPTENVVYEPGIDREEADLDKANVASSELRNDFLGRRHIVALDIDYPAHLIPSSTDGHYHLYLDVPGGIEHHKYMDLLEALARAGVIEEGYAEVSVKRGHSDLRLPWVKKADQKLSQGNPVIPSPNHPGEFVSPLTDPPPADMNAVDLSDLLPF